MPYLNKGTTMPTCPGNGKYTINAVSVNDVPSLCDVMLIVRNGGAAGVSVLGVEMASFGPPVVLKEKLRMFATNPPVTAASVGVDAQILMGPFGA